MKSNTILIIAMLISISAWSQQKINGKVFDKDAKTPLAGATIQSSELGMTTTDKDGAFSLPCSGSMEITISYVGYSTYRTKVENCQEALSIGLSAKQTMLNEIEVTASTESDKSLLQHPSSIVPLSKVELKRATGLYLDDAINTNIPGVFMERRTNSAGQQFNIRGYGNGVRGTNGVNSNFDGQGYKVYLNGIPITDAEGITIMDDIDFSSVGKVEVSKGPSGTLYGLAIAGVVNLQTQKAEKNKTLIGQDFMFGSYGLFRSTTSVSIGGENSSLLVNYGRQKSDGFMVHTAAHKDFVNVFSDFRINEKQSMNVYLGFIDSYDERNGELTIGQYDTMDYSGNPAYIRNNAHSAVKTFRAGIGHTYIFNKNISNTSSFFGSGQNMDNSSAGGWTDKNPLNCGLRSTINMHFDLSDKIMLNGLVGLEMQRMNTLANGYSMVTDSTNPEGYHVIGSLRSIQATTSSTASYFTQWTLGLPMEFSVTAGIGYSTMALSLKDRLWSTANNHPENTVPQEYKANYNGMYSPTIAINKTFKKTASVYIAYSVGYKAPVSSYFYIPTTGEVNTGLNPEKGAQIELGSKGSLFHDKLFYTVALFNAKFSDKMTTVAVPNPQNTATLYSYIVNGGNLNNKGLEVLVKYTAIHSGDHFVRLLEPFANLTYSNFKYEDYQYEKVGKDSHNKDSVFVYDYNGNDVAGVPPVVFNIGLDIDTRPGLYGNLLFNYRDAMYFTSDELNKTESYGVLNTKVGFRKAFRHISFDLYAGANNITGTQYYYMVFLNQLPDAYLPAPHNINFFGGINLKYIF